MRPIPLRSSRAPLTTRLAIKHSARNKSAQLLRPSVARDVLIALGCFDALIALNDAQVTQLPPACPGARQLIAATVTPPPHSSVLPHNPPPISGTPNQSRPQRGSDLPLLAPGDGTPDIAESAADATGDIIVNRSFKRKRSSSPGKIIVNLCWLFVTKFQNVRQPPTRIPGPQVSIRIVLRRPYLM